MTDVWSERAEAYRASGEHREGPDLDLLVEWAQGARTALDVAAGGHVARRLREAGLEVVAATPAPGMAPDVVAAPRTCRLPMRASTSSPPGSARITSSTSSRLCTRWRASPPIASSSSTTSMRGGVGGGRPHSRSLARAQARRGRVAAALLGCRPGRRGGAPAEENAPRPTWLGRTGCVGADAARVRSLLGERIEDDRIEIERIALRGSKA